MQANVLVKTIGLSHEEWLKWRQKGIGGSDAAAIAGLKMCLSNFFKIYFYR